MANKKDNIPVNKSNEFKNHKDFVEKYFNFLVTDYGFEQPTEQWVSREFHIKYIKENKKIDIAYEPSTLPWVTIEKDGNLKHIIEFKDNTNLKNIYLVHSKRVDPKTKRFVNKFCDKNIYDHSELDEDYEKWGKAEHEAVLKESAELIKRRDHLK